MTCGARLDPEVEVVRICSAVRVVFLLEPIL